MSSKADGLFRFPHMPHLAWLGATPPRSDKVLSADEARSLLSGSVVVEEKLDGANLGISVGDDGDLRYQNRGEYLLPPLGGQFARFPAWAGRHGHDLLQELGPGLILFGEWCAARHSVAYSHLPDWFVAFDVYDQVAGRFWSTIRRNALAERLSLSIAPCLLRGRTTLAALTTLVASSPSRFGAPRLEGVVVRHDDGQFGNCRAKLVRPDFVQSIGEHWRRRRIEWNQVAA